MGTQLWIWNSMASRRRSASDIFEENGLGILQTYLNAEGHQVRIFDWADRTGYSSLSPFGLKYINHLLFYALLASRSFPVVNKLFSKLSSKTQLALSANQKKRLQKRLTKLARQIAKEKIPVLGIKVWYGEAFTMSKFLVQEVNKYSTETLTIAGGYHASLYEEDILKYSNFDLAVAGSGEEVLNTLLHLMAQQSVPFNKNSFLDQLAKMQLNAPISGLIYRTDLGIKKNLRISNCSIPRAIPLYPSAINKIKVHVLIESLGCPWNACNFCVHNQFTQQYITRNIEDIINEINEIVKQGIALFRFAGSDTPPAYGKLIAEKILQNKLQIEYTMGCRAVKNCKERDVFENTRDAFCTMIKAGLRGIFIGGETGSDRINQQVMNKGISAEDIAYTIEAVRQAEKITGLSCTVSLAMIFPTPLLKDTSHEEVLESNLQLIKKVMPDAVMVSPPGPFKNTEWYRNSEKYGFELHEDFIPKVMEYEYVLYKPLNLWETVPFTLKGMNFREMLGLSQNFKQQIERQIGIPTDLSDEHFLMIKCSGALNKKRIKAFKHKSQLSIITSNYAYINRIGNKMSNYSRTLAKQNVK